MCENIPSRGKQGEKMSVFQEMFGDLRSLMNEKELNVDAIWSMLKAMAKEHQALTVQEES